jgi:hypothetical protein
MLDDRRKLRVARVRAGGHRRRRSSGRNRFKCRNCSESLRTSRPRAYVTATTPPSGFASSARAKAPVNAASTRLWHSGSEKSERQAKLSARLPFCFALLHFQSVRFLALGEFMKNHPTGAKSTNQTHEAVRLITMPRFKKVFLTKVSPNTFLWLSIVLSTILRKMKPKISVWENLW